MTYLTKTRALELKSPKGWHLVTPFNGMTYDVPFESRLGPTNQVGPCQTTYTWSNQDTSDSGLEDDLAIFRNGFTSYDPVDDRGHEFWTSKTSRWLSHWDYFSKLSTGDMMRGPLVPNHSLHDPYAILPQGGWNTAVKDPYPPLPVDTDVKSMGATAINRVAPGAPRATLASSLVELIRDTPKMIGHQLFTEGFKKTPSSVGGEYLNFKFGWQPTINDVKKCIKSLLHATELIRQFERDNGRVVRRRFAFPTTTTARADIFSQEGNGPLVYYNPGWFQAGDAREYLSRVDRTDREVWFSGAFSYYFPTGTSGIKKLQEFEAKANHLLGTRMDPEALWQLTPWSWLVDWYGTIGDIIGNANRIADNGLVIRYGYLMVHTTREYQWSTLPSLLDYDGKMFPTSSAFYRRETKRRYRATPFGFGLDLSDMNPQQWAILSALGLSHSQR